MNVFGRSGRFCGMSPRVSWAGLPYVPSAGPMACYGNTHILIHMITYRLLKTLRMTFLKPQRTPQHTSAPQHSGLADRCVLQPIHCSQLSLSLYTAHRLTGSHARLGPAVRRQVSRCNHLHVRRTSFSILLCCNGIVFEEPSSSTFRRSLTHHHIPIFERFFFFAQ